MVVIFNQKSELFVKVNWSRQFSPSYVRHILEIDKKNDGLGYVKTSNYLPKELFEKDYLYKSGDLYIVSQFLNKQSAKNGSFLEPCLYYLVQINAESEFGYVIIATVRETDSYPNHECKIVSNIIIEPNLLENVKVIENS